jgi:hypothetical protein
VQRPSKSTSLGSVVVVVIVTLAVYVSHNLSDNISRVRVSENRTIVSRAEQAGPIVGASSSSPSFPCLSKSYFTRACPEEEPVVCEFAEIDNHKIDPIGF